MPQVNRSCAPQWIVRLGFASRCPDLVVGWQLYSCFRRITHPDRRSLSLSEDRVGHCDSFPTFYGSQLSAVELCQPLALAQRSLVPVCTVGGAHRHVVQRSPGRCRFGGFEERTSPGAAALGHRCSYGHAVSLADSSAETCTTTMRL